MEEGTSEEDFVDSMDIDEQFVLTMFLEMKPQTLRFGGHCDAFASCLSFSSLEFLSFDY
jgi:hypothetical protein